MAALLFAIGFVFMVIVYCKEERRKQKAYKEWKKKHDGGWW